MSFTLEILDWVKTNNPVAIFTAVVATLNLFVLWYISRRQIRASLISANRQAWINSLRDDLSELFELLDWTHRLRPGTFAGQDGYRHEDDKRSRIRLLIYKIRLKLNPEELDNKELLKTVEALKNNPDNFYNIIEKTVSISQDILKREWNRVKNER